MAKYRYLSENFWEDPYMLELKPLEKLFYNFILTSPKASWCGAYEISIKQIEYYTSLDKEIIEQLIVKFTEFNKIEYNKENMEILIKNWYKYHPMDNSNLEKAIKREISKLKSIEFQNYLRIKYNLQAPTKPLNEIIQAPTKPLPSPLKKIDSPYQHTETETETETKTKESTSTEDLSTNEDISICEREEKNSHTHISNLSLLKTIEPDFRCWLNELLGEDQVEKLYFLFSDKFSQGERQLLIELFDCHGEELFKAGIKVILEKGKNSLKYLENILKNKVVENNFKKKYPDKKKPKTLAELVAEQERESENE